MQGEQVRDVAHDECAGASSAETVTKKHWPLSKKAVTV